MQLLKWKNALITGGTAGIGKAIACLYVENGASVAILGTNQDRALAALKEIEDCKINSDQKVTSFIADVSKTKEVEEIIEKILNEWEKIDILVNNAGITRD